MAFDGGPRRWWRSHGGCRGLRRIVGFFGRTLGYREDDLRCAREVEERGSPTLKEGIEEWLLGSVLGGEERDAGVCALSEDGRLRGGISAKWGKQGKLGWLW